MQIESRDGKISRRILIAMIVDSVVCGRVSTKWEKRGLFKSKWENLIGGWCVDYHKKYGKAPRKYIQGMFETWAEESNDKDTIKMVERFLVALSDEYTTKKEVNSEYIIDLASKYFNSVGIVRVGEEAERLVSAGELEKAVSLITSFGKIELGEGGYVDVLQDKSAMRQSFQTRSKPLIDYPGALGKFLGNALSRDALISFEGTEKKGKCVSGDMEVLLVDGQVRTIQEIVQRKIKIPIVTLNEETQKFEHSKCSEFWSNGKKECASLETKSGRKVTTTLNHKYLTPKGWKHLDEIKLGDFVAVPKRIPFFGNLPLKEEEIKFLAYILAEGGCTSGQMNFTNTDKELIQDFEGSCSKLGVGYKRKGITHHLTKCGEIARRFGFYHKSSKTKEIPQELFRCPKHQISLFLKVFFTCDGTIYNDRGKSKIEITLANKKLINQISHLLLRFGIVCKTGPKKAQLNGKFFPAWRLSISSQEYVQLFLQEIGFLSYKHTEPCKVNTQKSFLDKLPWQVAKAFLEELRKECGKGNFYKLFGKSKAQHVKTQIRKRQPLMRQSFVHMKGYPAYEKYLNNDIMWDEVLALKNVGLRDTYDLSIPKHHNFIANDCIVHNTWMLLDLAWRAMCQRNKVAFFEVGDLSQDQIMMRFMIRAAKHPQYPCTIKYPVSMKREPDTYEAEVDYKEIKFQKSLDYNKARKGCKDVMQSKIRSKESYLRLSVHPNNTISILGVREILRRWEKEGWVPDVFVIDYADILAPISGFTESRDQINATWMQLRALTQTYHCLGVVATQASAGAYGADTIGMGHYSNDKRKRAHVTGSIGINQTESEKMRGVIRWNWVVLREARFSSEACVHLAGCLDLANPIIKSTF